jgi:hypothetical protein
MSDAAQRDSYRIDLKCPDCGGEGAADVSEEDYPFTENRRFSVDQVTSGFSVQNVGSRVTEVEIVCSACKVSARPTGPRSLDAPTSRAIDAVEKSLTAEPLAYFRSSMISSSRARSK